MARGKRSEIPVQPRLGKTKPDPVAPDPVEPEPEAAPEPVPMDAQAIADQVQAKQDEMAADNAAALDPAGAVDPAPALDGELDEAPPEQAIEPDLVAETLTGDIRDALLAELRSMSVGWNFLTEKHQRSKVALCEDKARRLVDAVIDQVVGFDWPSVQVVIEDVHVRKDLRIKLSASIADDSFASLGRQVGRAAMLVMVDAKGFTGERKPVDIVPDQAAFPGT